MADEATQQLNTKRLRVKCYLQRLLYMISDINNPEIASKLIEQTREMRQQSFVVKTHKELNALFIQIFQLQDEVVRTVISEEVDKKKMVWEV